MDKVIKTTPRDAFLHPSTDNGQLKGKFRYGRELFPVARIMRAGYGRASPVVGPRHGNERKD
jgi:hypothetical protein